MCAVVVCVCVRACKRVCVVLWGVHTGLSVIVLFEGGGFVGGVIWDLGAYLLHARVIL